MINKKQNAQLFDYKDYNGDNVMQVWADNLPLQKKDRGRLDSKIDMLERVGDDLPPGLLQNTRCNHILELAANGQVAIRAMLCRGPITMQNEFTFLFGATERDRKYVPRDAPQKADKNRSDLISTKRRCKHARFQKNDHQSIQR
jgi:hypothetical protein